MKIEQLNLTFVKYFVDAINFGGITEAAIKNHVSRPAVSQAFKRLEDLLGFALTTRKKNQFVVTPEGRSFYHKAAEILSSGEAILNQKERSTKTLRIGCSASLFDSILVPALSKIKGDVRIKFGTSSAIREQVEDGKIDFGIMIDDGHNKHFNSKELYHGNFVLLGTKDSLKKGIITTEDRAEVIRLISDLQKLKVPSNLTSTRIESWTACYSLASKGMGACLVPDIINRKGLKSFFPKTISYPYKVICIWKSHSIAFDENEFLGLF